MAAAVVQKKQAWVQTDYTARLLREVELPWQTDQTAFPATGQVRYLGERTACAAANPPPTRCRPACAAA
eukprot:SAG22_NODE_101_length_20519_cov_15.588002_4_plen_69_part_00